MLMGSAEAKLVEPPKETQVFVEDLPEDQQVCNEGQPAHGDTAAACVQVSRLSVTPSGFAVAGCRSIGSGCDSMTNV
jgi:hypothetical protein